MPRFLDDDAMGDMLFAVVLGSAFCLTTNTREQTLLGNAQKHRSNGASILETTRCLRGIDLFRRLIFGYEQIRITRALLFEHIDGNGIIGQVGMRYACTLFFRAHLRRAFAILRKRAANCSA